MDLEPLVSVVIPTYNRKELVARAVHSVLAQTYKNLECIVVDDCSTDGTDLMLEKLALNDSRVRVIRHAENRHVSAARNTGIAASRGEFVAFLDDDDVWLPRKLELQVRVLLDAPATVGLVYCWLDIYRGAEVVGTRRPALRGNVFERMMLSQPLGNASTLLVRRETAVGIGGFDESLPRGNDGDFIRRISERYEVELVPEVLVHYFVDHEGYRRITSRDRAGVLNAAKGHEAKLVKFKDALSERPDLHAALLAHIGRHYARAGDGHRAIASIRAAQRVRPFALHIYVQAAKAVIDFLFRRAPVRATHETVR